MGHTSYTQTIDVAGFPFANTTPERLASWVVGRRGSLTTSCVVLVNPHSILACDRNPQMDAAIRAAELILPDGVGVTLASRMFGQPLTRVTGPGLMLSLCDLGRRFGLRHYFFGGLGDTAERLAREMTERYPGLAIAGATSPRVGSVDELTGSSFIDPINNSGADVVWVGLGAPKQEIWMHKSRSLLKAAVLIGVGAAFDFHTGNIPWAPECIRKIGLEWAYRLVHEPKRLWRRNVDSPLFLLKAATHHITRHFVCTER